MKKKGKSKTGVKKFSAITFADAKVREEAIKALDSVDERKCGLVIIQSVKKVDKESSLVNGITRVRGLKPTQIAQMLDEGFGNVAQDILSAWLGFRLVRSLQEDDEK